VIAQDESGMQSNHWYTVARNGNDLETPVVVGQKAARRALRRLAAAGWKRGRFRAVRTELARVG